MKIFTGIFAIVIAIACFWFSITFLSNYFKVMNWDRVDAKILSKGITIHEQYSTSRTPYKLNATYSYNYSNKSYSGHHIYLAELMGGQVNHIKSDVDMRLEEIKSNMSIYVNPENPQESVMYCDGVLLYAFVFVMGLFALLIGAVKFF